MIFGWRLWSSLAYGRKFVNRLGVSPKAQGTIRTWVWQAWYYIWALSLPSLKSKSLSLIAWLFFTFIIHLQPWENKFSIKNTFKCYNSFASTSLLGSYVLLPDPKHPLKLKEIKEWQFCRQLLCFFYMNPRRMRDFTSKSSCSPYSI